MNLENQSWNFEEAIAKDTCEKIIKSGLSEKKSLGAIRTEQHKVEPDTKKRNSHISWLDETWLYKLLEPYIHLANIKAGWNFQWDWIEPAQFTIYKKGQFYSWHTDGAEKAEFNIERKDYFGKIRKITCLTQLTDPSEYQGGDIHLDPRQNDPDKIKSEFITPAKKQGTVVCFPSFTWHRAQPIIKGTRYSLQMWCWGRPYK